MSSPTWLLAVLAQCAKDGLHLDGALDRDRIADAIAEAFPRVALMNGLGGAAAQVLKAHSIRDGAQELAGEIARHGAQIAQCVLELPPEAK